MKNKRLAALLERKQMVLEELAVYRDTNPRYELCAAPGRCLEPGLHSVICYNMTDVCREAREQTTEECTDPDCDVCRDPASPVDPRD